MAKEIQDPYILNPNRRHDSEIGLYKAGISDQRSLLEVQAHPVTRVYCDELGIVCFERHQAEPLKMAVGDPKRSRVAALRRVEALLDTFRGNETDFRRMMPISDTGVGLTYDALREQVVQACQQSREIQARRDEQFQQKKDRYKIK